MKKPTTPALNRRTVFAGAGAVGALAAVASVLPNAREAAPAAAPADKAETSAGYRLSEHVKQYYATART